jgi:hypothetical protein
VESRGAALVFAYTVKYSNVSHLLSGVDLAIELVLILHELEDDLVPLVVVQLLLAELDVLVLGDGIGVISIPMGKLR